MNASSEKLFRRLSLALAAVGLAMLSVAFLSNAIGLTHDPLSKARILLGGLGAIVLAAGVLGQRFARCYTVCVVMLANALLLLVVRSDEMPAYDAVQKEGSLAAVTKAFYVGWRGRPHQGVAVTVDEEGLRVTPSPSAALSDDAIRVFTFGGSTMWGEGGTDEETIAAYLQTMLSAEIGLPARVTNFAQRAWVSSQSLIQLTLELKRGHVPDVVVFYDGYNEIVAAYATGRAGVPENVDLRDVFEGIGAPIYHDPCHIRGEGNKRVAEAILERGLLSAVLENNATNRATD